MSIDRLLPVPVPWEETGPPWLVELNSVGLPAPTMVSVPVATTGGATHIVGTAALKGLADFVTEKLPVLGTAPVGWRSQPATWGLGEALKYEEGLVLRPSLVGCVMTAMTLVRHAGLAHSKASTAFAAALVEYTLSTLSMVT